MSKIKTFIFKWQPELILLAVFSFLYFIILPFIPIIDGDTFYYIAKAKKMLFAGDWLNLKTLMAKPVLGIWVMAFSYKLLGVSLFSTYFWHTLFALGILLIVYFFMREFVSRQAALISSAVLLTSLMFFYQVTSPMLDLPMLFWLSLACWFLYKYIYYGKAFYLYFTAVVCALNFLTKGLLGGILPAVIFGFYLLVTKTNPLKEYKNFILHSVISILLFASIISVWLVPQYQAHGQRFLTAWYQENIVRFFKPIDETGGYRQVSSGVQRDPHINIIYIFFSLLPWSALLLPVLLTGFKDKKYFPKRELFLFLLIWFLFVAFITTVSGHYKGPRYLLPFFPAAAMILGMYLEQLIQKGLKSYKKLTVNTFAALAVFLGLLFLVILATNFQHGENQYKPFVLTFFGFYLLTLLAGAYFWQKEKISSGIVYIVILAVISYTLFLVQGSWYIKKIFPNYGVAVYLKSFPQEKIIVWKIKERALDFYLNKEIIYLNEPGKLKAEQGNFFIVAEQSRQKELKKIKPAKKQVYSFGNWLVFK